MMLKAVQHEMKHGKVARRELGVSKHVPYLRHVRDDVIKTREGYFITVIKLNGFAFETADLSDINARMMGRNDIIRQLGSSRFSVTNTVIRRQVRPELEGDFVNPFCHELDWRYSAKLNEQRMYVNDCYFTILRRDLRGQVGVFDAVAKRLRTSKGLDGISVVDQEALNELLDVTSNIEQLLGAYGARRLGVVGVEKGLYRSEMCEFLVQILNGGMEQKMLLPRMSLAEALPTKRLFFGVKAIEIRGATPEDTRYGTMISTREYPPFSGPGILDGLLAVPYEFILTQSFSVVDKPETLMRINRISRQIDISDEAGSIVARQLELAQDEILSSEAVYGEHHLTVMPLVKNIADLNVAVMAVMGVLNNTSAIAIREDLNQEGAFWAQLPGNLNYVARKAIISSKNFAGFASLHNFPSGKASGNHWGPALSIFETTSQTAYYFNFHRADLGNFTAVGPSGSGKTVFLSFIAAQSQRINPKPRLIFVDKDRGAEIFIRAMGGTYEVMEPGEKTGFNPFMQDNTPANRDFLFQLLSFMLRPADGFGLKANEEQLLRQAISVQMEASKAQKTFNNFATLLRGQIRATDNDLYTRLQSWMKDDQDGWLFNNKEDNFELSSIFGFDMTSVLEIPKIRTAALMYIFHRIEQMLDGKPTLIFLDEGWKLLDDDVFVRFIKDKLKTIRKLNGVVGFGTQSASDIVNSKAANTLIEQSATNIFFPNSRADEASYKKAFNLSDREFRWIKESVPEQRQFIVKTAGDSVIAGLNLNGMPDVIKVLSGRKETVNELYKVMETCGPDPKDWMPVFLEKERSGLT